MVEVVLWSCYVGYLGGAWWFFVLFLLAVCVHYIVISCRDYVVHIDASTMDNFSRDTYQTTSNTLSNFGLRTTKGIVKVVVGGVLAFLRRGTVGCGSGATFISLGSSMACTRLLRHTRDVNSTLDGANAGGGPVTICFSGYMGAVSTVLNIICDKGFCIIVSDRVPPTEVGGVFNTLSPITIVASGGRRRGTLRLRFSNSVFSLRRTLSYRVGSRGLTRVHDERVSASPLCTLFASNSANIPGNTIIDRGDIVTCSR